MPDVFLLRPTGPDFQLRTSAGSVIERIEHLGRDHGMPKQIAEHKRSEAQMLGVARQSGEHHRRVKARSGGSARLHLHQMIGWIEAVKAKVIADAGNLNRMGQVTPELPPILKIILVMLVTSCLAS